MVKFFNRSSIQDPAQVDLETIFIDYLKIRDKNKLPYILVFAPADCRFEFLCVPFNFELFLDTKDWKKSIPIEFHFKNMNLLIKLFLSLLGYFYYGVQVRISRQAVIKLTDSFNDESELVGFVDYTIRSEKDEEYPVKLIMLKKHKWMLSPNMRKITSR
jgi:hypothetical protein